LHGQGVNKLGQGLVAEAYAPDGLIESIRVENAKTFALGVQWHPEWLVLENPAYLSIFRAFGDACRMRQLERAAPD
jgi:putative glutamine amidotransferase